MSRAITSPGASPVWAAISATAASATIADVGGLAPRAHQRRMVRGSTSSMIAAPVWLSSRRARRSRIMESACQKLKLNAKPLNDAADGAMTRDVTINKHSLLVGVLKDGNERCEIVGPKNIACYAGLQHFASENAVAAGASGDAMVVRIETHFALLGGRAVARADNQKIGQHALAVNIKSEGAP